MPIEEATACLVRWGGQTLHLLPERASGGRPSGVLFVADLHLGKAATYRALGQPVPGGTTQENLARIERLIEARQPEQVVFLGDFLHAAQARTPALLAALEAWRARQPRPACTLVRGNHDSRAGDPPASLRIAVVDEPHLIGPFAACHHPQMHPTHFVLAGHLHPDLQAARPRPRQRAHALLRAGGRAGHPAGLRRVHRRLARGGRAGAPLLRRRRRCRLGASCFRNCDMTEPIRSRPGVDLREHAVHLLMQAAPLAGMGLHEARVVVDAMRPLHLLADTLLFEEGDAVDNDYMVLVLEGQLRVVSSSGVAGDEVVISVIDPGSLVGEMGVIDGGPRSASCTALTDVKLGVLSRGSLMELVETHPGAAARLMLGVSKGLAAAAARRQPAAAHAVAASRARCSRSWMRRMR